MINIFDLKNLKTSNQEVQDKMYGQLKQTCDHLAQQLGDIDLRLRIPYFNRGTCVDLNIQKNGKHRINNQYIEDVRFEIHCEILKDLPRGLKHLGTQYRSNIKKNNQIINLYNPPVSDFIIAKKRIYPRRLFNAAVLMTVLYLGQEQLFFLCSLLFQ